MLTLISIPELSTKQVNSGNLLMSHLLLLLITACMSLPNFKKCSVEYNTSLRLYLWFKYDKKRAWKKVNKLFLYLHVIHLNAIITTVYIIIF